MAERLTKQFMYGLGHKECSDACAVCDVTGCCDLLEEMLEKLAHYEELEEQGRLIELPCKIGDTVYGIRRFHGDRIVKSGTVSEMYYNQNMKLVIVIKNLCRGFWGENIFGTHEEAEAALKEVGK